MSGIGQARHSSASGLFFPMEVRPDVSASLPAYLAGEPGLYVRQPDVIGPSVAADRRPVRAVIIRAIDQQPANAGFAHLAEGDLLRPRHAP